MYLLLESLSTFAESDQPKTQLDVLLDFQVAFQLFKMSDVVKWPQPVEAIYPDGYMLLINFNDRKTNNAEHLENFRNSEMSAGFEQYEWEAPGVTYIKQFPEATDVVNMEMELQELLKVIYDPKPSSMIEVRVNAY